MKRNEQIKEFVVNGVNETPADVEQGRILAGDIWRKLKNTGTRLWLDTGDADAAQTVWTPDFEALTTNNSLLNKEIQKGGYDELIKESACFLRENISDLSPSDLLLEINFILNARHGLRLAQRFGGRVSVELHTSLANDVDGSVEYGKRFYEVCPEQFYIKVPLTPAGLIAARRLGQQNIPVNLTLGFSARQNFFAAQFSRPAFVNVFLGRLNSFVEQSGIGTGENVGEKTVRATQCTLRTLRESGRTESHLIAASMRSAQQVTDLTGVDLMTMPVSVAAEYIAQPMNAPADQMEEDLYIPMMTGFTTADFHGDTLWDVPEPFQKLVQQLVANHPDSATPLALMDCFTVNGFSDFMPAWSLNDIDQVMNDGKIPDFKIWGPRLKSGEIGLDALMNISALTAFVTDQQELDERISSLL